MSNENTLPVFVEPARDEAVINEFVARAKASEALIPEILENGAGYTPYDDMILYMIICTPKLSDEEMEGVNTDVLDMIFEGDKEGDVTNQKLTLISKGAACKKDMSPGDRIAIRGHAFKVTTPKGTFFTVREYDVIGRYDV